MRQSNWQVTPDYKVPLVSVPWYSAHSELFNHLPLENSIYTQSLRTGEVIGLIYNNVQIAVLMWYSTRKVHLCPRQNRKQTCSHNETCGLQQFWRLERKIFSDTVQRAHQKFVIKSFLCLQEQTTECCIPLPHHPSLVLYFHWSAKLLTTAIWR